MAKHAIVGWQAPQPPSACGRGDDRWRADCPSCLEGNQRDSSTVPSVLKDVEERFGLRRVVFVGDRGMVTSKNIELLRGRSQGYVVGLNRRRRPEVLDYLQRATGPWQQCRAGIVASEKAEVPKTLVQEVASDKAGVRVFVVHSDERMSYERAEREKSMQRVREELSSLETEWPQASESARKNRRPPPRIYSQAWNSLLRWEIKRDVSLFEHPVNLKQNRPGRQVLIQTEEHDLWRLKL